MKIAAQLIVFFLSLTAIDVQAQYAVSEISSELKKGADVVIRTSEEVMTVRGVEDITFSEKAAYTIMNKEGFGLAVFYRYYDKLSKLKGIKITYYDANGKTIKRVKSNEIQDVNITGSGSVYDDNRIKYFEPDEFAYPFTVAFEYESVEKTSLNFRPFVAQPIAGISVEKAVYRAYTPKGYELRYKELNGINPTNKQSLSDKDIYEWTIENEPALKSELAGESVRTRAKSVLLAPSSFSVEGYDGDMSTWKGLGQWQYALNQGRDNLPENVKSEVRQLVADAENDKEKVRRVYQYLQENTRYVSIQLGIGGWQPFPATMVAENGYGDCKALSNYTASLLKAAGIKSNYVIIKAGPDEDDIVTDFPSNQFNHVILAVPMEKDTVWLECTSQEAPFNFLGGFTSDRHALMVTEKGGTLIKTPEYPAEQNSQVRKALVTFDAEGNATAEITTVYEGRQYDINSRIATKGTEEQRKYLLNVIDIPVFDLGDFDYNQEKSENPVLTETYDLSLRKYGSVTGKRLFFVPNLLNRRSGVPPRNENRQSAIIRRFNYMDIDSVVFKLPENYRMEFEPETVELDSEFGEYKLSYDFNPDTNEFTFVRYIKVYKGKFPANTYGDYRGFWRKVARSDKSKLVLVGNT